LIFDYIFLLALYGSVIYLVGIVPLF